MRQFLRKIPVFSIVILTVVLSATLCFAWDSQTEVRRLNKEVPSIQGYNGTDSLIWLRNNDFRMLNDGSMENTRYTVVMMGESIPDLWKSIRMPVPADGSLDIVEASWYNPMTGAKEGNLNITEDILNGGAVVKTIDTPNGAVGRAVVLVVKTKHQKRYGVDETIEMAGPIPIWEQIVTVELPEGRELYWLARDVKDPSVEQSAGIKSYKWTIMNQEAWSGEGFVVYKRPSLSFSFRKGLVQSLKTMEETAAMIPDIHMPSFAANGDKTKAGVRLMEWLAAPSRTLTGFSRQWIRTSAQIPKDGPWTPGEQTLILNKWLRKLGWESNVWWQATSELNNESPASNSLWVAPVLELTTTGYKKALYQSGQTSALGVVAPSIAGTEIYRLNKEEYEKKAISPGSPSDHKLELLWRLNLDQNGTADGTLSVSVSGGWTDLMSDGYLPSQDGLSKFIQKRINFAITGMTLTPTSVESTRMGYRIEFQVKCTPGLSYGGSLLLRLPGGIPARLVEMIGKETSYAFRFPFIIDQKVRINMPAGYKMIQTPPLKKLGDGTKAVLKESITYWPKKAQLLADSTWTVKTSNVDAQLAAVLKEELAACMRWPVLDIPFRK